MSAPPETPPKDDKNAGKINVAFPDGDTLSFKIKKTAPFSKVYESIANNKDISANSFSLSFDGVRINKEATPKMLELSEGDQIEVNLAQVGGMSARAHC